MNRTLPKNKNIATQLRVLALGEMSDMYGEKLLCDEDTKLAHFIMGYVRGLRRNEEKKK